MLLETRCTSSITNSHYPSQPDLDMPALTNHDHGKICPAVTILVRSFGLQQHSESHLVDCALLYVFHGDMISDHYSL